MKGVVCKLEIEKAYGSLNWPLLMKILQCMEFGCKWRNGIWWCYCEILSPGQRGPNRLFPKHKRFEAGRPSLPVPFCHEDGGSKYFTSKGYDR